MRKISFIILCLALFPLLAFSTDTPNKCKETLAPPGVKNKRKKKATLEEILHEVAEAQKEPGILSLPDEIEITVNKKSGPKTQVVSIKPEEHVYHMGWGIPVEEAPRPKGYAFEDMSIDEFDHLAEEVKKDFAGSAYNDVENLGKMSLEEQKEHFLRLENGKIEAKERGKAGPKERSWILTYGAHGGFSNFYYLHLAGSLVSEAVEGVKFPHLHETSQLRTAVGPMSSSLGRQIYKSENNNEIKPRNKAEEKSHFRGMYRRHNRLWTVVEKLAERATLNGKGFIRVTKDNTAKWQYKYGQRRVVVSKGIPMISLGMAVARIRGNVIPPIGDDLMTLEKAMEVIEASKRSLEEIEERLHAATAFCTDTHRSLLKLQVVQKLVTLGSKIVVKKGVPVPAELEKHMKVKDEGINVNHGQNLFYDPEDDYIDIVDL